MSAARNLSTAAFEARRNASRRQRTSPDDLLERRLVIRPDGRQRWQPPLKEPNPNAIPAPAEIWIHLTPTATNDSAAPAAPLPWDFGQWLDTTRNRWADRKIDLCFVSFDPVSTKSLLFDRLRALADRAVPWLVRVLIDGKHIASTAILDQLLRCGPDELVVYLAGLGEPTVSPRVLGAVKDLVDLRTARGQNLPKIICRLCPPNGSGPGRVPELALWARQVGVDRLEVTDKLTEEKRLWA